MNCKYCSRAIPDDAIFCPYCGERVTRRQRQKKAAPRYPKPRSLADGSLLGQVMIDGERVTVKAWTGEEYRARIDGLRTGILEKKAHPEKRTLSEILRAYIDANDAVLSPSTIRGYEYIYKGRFSAYRALSVDRIDFQKMVNDEAKQYAPKTVKNAWALVEAALRYAKLPVPDVNLPMIPPSEEDFLDYEQIERFLAAVKGDPCELAALLMLHGLRLSELLDLDASDVQGGKIRIHGAVVRDKSGKLVEKATNKNATSAREVDIMISRLSELLPESGKLVTLPPTTLTSRIARVCEKAGLPVCSPHDLRRSCASLAYHLGWSERAIMELLGWHSMQTAHKFYIKISRKDFRKDVANMQNYYKFTTENKKSAD